jgi:hypothetical protein
VSSMLVAGCCKLFLMFEVSDIFLSLLMLIMLVVTEVRWMISVTVLHNLNIPEVGMI